MNKYAAEKIASDYYNMGVQLALQSAGIGMNKTANKKNVLMGGLAGLGGAASLPYLKALGAEAAMVPQKLRDAYGIYRAPKLFEEAQLNRFVENLRQNATPSSWSKNLAATENLNLAKAQSEFADEELAAILANMKGFSGLGGDDIRGLGNFMAAQKLNLVDPLKLSL